jgi:hypothetical protein
MKLNFKITAPIAMVFAIFFGGILLLSYIFNLNGLRGFILDWVMVVSAAALLLGVLNLLLVHLDKVRKGQNRVYSLVLIFSLVVTFLVTLWQGPLGVLSYWLFQYIQVPVEASLAAVMTITLAYSAMRLLSRRPDMYSIVFVIFAALALLSSVPFLGFNIPLLNESLRGFNQLLSSAGARGILLGVALGTIATGLRILLGADRPYGG